MAGYLIAVVAFTLPLLFGLTGAGRTRMVLATGAVLALGWFLALVADQPQNRDGGAILPLWLLAGLVGLLYLLWCGGLWIGVRLRRARST